MANGKIDLHDLSVPNADGPAINVGKLNHGCRVTAADVQVVFRRLEDELVSLILQSEAVFGCVAWLTNLRILDALASCKAVSIVVQKEDFLRPDGPAWSKARLHAAYARLRTTTRDLIPGVELLSTNGPQDVSAVRCVGNHNTTKNPSWPRMHNKFLVFCTQAPMREDSYDPGHFYPGQFLPHTVWTGSFNLSDAATRSFENAVIIRERRLADAFHSEYGAILALSEPLNWSSSWVEPEWRIGT